MSLAGTGKPFERVRRWLLHSDGDLPARVQTVIRLQQDRAEVVVSVIQLLVVAFVGTLFVSARMAQGQVQEVELFSEINVIAIYAVLTVLRLILALRHRLTPWMLYLSVVIDMSLLMALIWNIHLKYGQAASFYLKAPTFVYIFMFIALRALRFEAKYVLFAGAVAAAGWILLLLFALGVTDTLDLYGVPRPQSCEVHPCVTSDFIAYMHTDMILVGAEVDKLVIVLVTTAILALAIERARRLLVRSVTEATAARDLSRFLDPEVAERIRSSELAISAGEGELRDAAILTTDLRGFTRISTSMPADEVVRLLQDYQHRLCPAIQAEGGSIDKFLGDGILCSFGATRPSQTWAADALRAADAVTETVDKWNRDRAAQGLQPMQVGLAVASGQVLFGAVGSADRLEYTVIGDAVNLAAKLEKHTKEERVRALTDSASWQAALRQGYRPPAARATLERRNVAGVAAPLDLVCLA